MWRVGENKRGETSRRFQGWFGIIYGAVLFTRLQRSGGASYTHKQVMLKSGKERGTEDWVRHELFVVHVSAVCSSSRFLQIWGCFTSPACILPFTEGTDAHMCSLGINSRGPMRWTVWAICGATLFSFLSCSWLYEYIQIRSNCGFFWPSIDNASAHSGLQLNRSRDDKVLVCSRKSTCSRLVLSLFSDIHPSNTCRNVQLNTNEGGRIKQLQGNNVLVWWSRKVTKFSWEKWRRCFHRGKRGGET